MSILSLLYKRILSKLEDGNSPDLESTNDAESDSPQVEIPSIEGDGDLVSVEPSAPPFKPQVLDNGRTLLLGVTGNENKRNAPPHSSTIPSSGYIVSNVVTNKSPSLSTDEIAAILDTPEEEEKDAAIVYKLKCSKCDVNGKIDSFTETFVCPLCGGTMYLIEAYANHLQHSPEEIKQELCVLYSKFNRGDLRAQKTWALLISQSHSDRKLEEYMRQYIKPHSAVEEKTPNSSSVIVSSTIREIQNNPKTSICPSRGRIELSPAQKSIQSPHLTRPVNPTAANSYFLIPELKQIYKNVNESNSVKYLLSNNEQSLLRGLGYKVGKSSKLTTIDRRKILVKAFVAETFTINAKWNKPMTQERVAALISLLQRLNDSDFYKMNDYSVAIKNRKEDIAWLSNYTEFLKEAIQIARTTAFF